MPLNPTTGAISSGQSVQTYSAFTVFGVACTTSNCLGVGFTGDNPGIGAAVPLNPATGAISSGQGVQSVAGTTELYGAACPTSTQCLAGADNYSFGNPRPGLAVPLNPTTGAVSSGQSAQAIFGTGIINGVACPTAFQCLGLGANQDRQVSQVGIAVPLDPATGAEYIAPGPYSPLTPTRICDTRAGNPSALSGAAAQCNGIFNSGSTIAAGGTLTLTVAGSFGVPADASAVVLNVTAVSPSGPGFLTAYPTGAGQPLASSLNYVAGEVVPNLVEVGTGSGGQISIYSQAKTDVVVDLEGYVAPTAAGGSGAGLYMPLASPARLCDTRAANPSGLVGGDAQCNGVANAGTRLAAGATHNVVVANNNAIPLGATAAVLNVTVVNPAASGYLSVFPEGATQPNTANVNYAAGQVTGNRVIVPLSSTGAHLGEVSIYSKAAADVVVDVSGYYSARRGEPGRSSAPSRPRCGSVTPGRGTPRV